MHRNIFTLINRILNSISLLPAVLALGFCLITPLIVLLPNPNLEGTVLDFMSITDDESIKTIISFVISGIFTLTVFSYTMVMNVLNRSISNYSPRLIPLLLNEKHHQVILGVTSGTILYSLSLALLITSETQIVFPNLGAAIAIILTAISVLLFIYFIHSVSQSIHINYILESSFENTRNNIKELIKFKDHLVWKDNYESTLAFEINNEDCGYLNEIRLEDLVKTARENNLQIEIVPLWGSFILSNTGYLKTEKPLSKKLSDKIQDHLSIDRTEPLDVAEIGFKHLAEIAIKASSPAINDPGTSISCIDYLTELFIFKLNLHDFNSYVENDRVLLRINTVSLSELLEFTMIDMVHYMKKDPILFKKITAMLDTLYHKDQEGRMHPAIASLRLALT